MEGIDTELDTLRQDASLVEEALGKKQGERDAILALYRRGRIDDATLDAQLREIEGERAELQARLDDLRSRLNGLEDVGSRLDQAEVLLRELNARLDSKLTWETRREIVEILVAGIGVNTIGVNGGSEVQVTVTYRFSEPPATDVAGATVGRAYRCRGGVTDP
jgi:site-specific DNA recombinase